MKKFRIKYTSKRGNEHEATVVLDDQTAEELLATGDKQLLHEYLWSVHKENKRNRVEDYWCHSLEEDQENGIEYLDKEEQFNGSNFLVNMNDSKLEKAAKQLNVRQKELLRLYFQNRKTELEIANLYGVTKQAIHQAIKRAIESIKRNY